jgi:hypothetical protein
MISMSNWTRLALNLCGYRWRVRIRVEYLFSLFVWSLICVYIVREAPGQQNLHMLLYIFKNTFFTFYNTERFFHSTPRLTESWFSPCWISWSIVSCKMTPGRWNTRFVSESQEVVGAGPHVFNCMAYNTALKLFCYLIVELSFHGLCLFC